MLYAGTDRGVFKSTDGGRSWSAANSGLQDQYVLALALAPGSPATLYAGTSGGVFRSRAGGADWTAINVGLTEPYANLLAIDPAASEIVYAGTPQGIFKSTNGGNSWIAVTDAPVRNPVSAERDPNGLSLAPRYTAALDPTSPTTVYAGTAAYTYPGTWRSVRGGVFKSTDGGQSWKPLYDGNTSFGSLLVDPATPTTLYAGTDNTGLYKSMDGGMTWDAINNGLPHPTIHALTFNPAQPTTLYVYTDDGVFTSTDGGQNWTQLGKD